MYKILFVCTGNICRSPTAEGVFRHLVAENHLDDKVFIDSAGTHAYHVGEKPDHRSIQMALSQGIDMSDQRARAICAEDFEEFDLIMAMDQGHYQSLKDQVDTYDNINLFLDYHPQYTGQGVPDPYYSDQNAFAHVLNLVHETCEYILEDIKAKLA